MIHPERLEIRIKDAATDGLDEPKTINIPWCKPGPVRRREIILPVEESSGCRTKPIRVEEQRRLLKAINLARGWLEELIAGTVEDVSALAEREQKSERSVRMTLSLAFLDPAIVMAAMQGKLPRGYGVSRLVDLPPAFVDQWIALGLTRPAA